ncbi:hypothetical protein TNCV_1767961 [Trichonephila clavipes]|nr:hypothetical protein TNCV_1767961 [Trichonephila clavipes]
MLKNSFPCLCCLKTKSALPIDQRGTSLQVLPRGKGLVDNLPLNKTSSGPDHKKMAPHYSRTEYLSECSFNYYNEIGIILVSDDPTALESFRLDWLVLGNLSVAVTGTKR